MILHRVAQAIRQQQWSQVTIEIIIVVVGIFLGLQVSQWNEGRQERIEEREYLERLSAELKETIIFNENVNNELAAVLHKLANALDMAHTGRLNSETKAEFEQNFHASNFFPHPIVQSSVISEMIATGKIAIIESSSLKDSIVGFNNEISREQINLDGQFNEFLSVRNSIATETRLRSDYWTSKKMLDSAEEIANNKVLIGKLSFTHEFQTKQLEQLQEFLEHTRELEANIHEHLGITH